MLALWQLGRYCVTALLTTLPYNIFQSSCANTNLCINLIYQHANDLKITKLNPANSWYGSNKAHYIAVIYVTYFQIYYYLVLCFH